MLGDVPNIIVNPTPCPWGFNTASRAPTFAESLQHDLCEIEAVLAGRMGISDYLRELVDDAWKGLAWIWSQIKAGVQWTEQQAIEIFQPLWDAVAKVWTWLEWNVGPWVIGLGAVALLIVFSPEIADAMTDWKGSVRHHRKKLSHQIRKRLSHGH